jgi:uncharacterized membrane protein YeaQ/YmgE (transglycosylase-associated protein family)
VLGTNSLIVVLLVGLISGWLASKIVDGTGLGIIADIIIGVIGAFIGRWLFSYFHIRVGVNFWVDAILTATFGAIVLLVVIRLIKRACGGAERPATAREGTETNTCIDAGAG